MVRVMQPTDWAAVRSIFEEGIATGHATFEPEAPSWELWDARHHLFGRLVAVEGDIIAGWTALGPVSVRPVYAGVAEISIYVGTGHRGRGIGGRLIQAAIAAS